MQIFIMRHGDAVLKAANDSLRPLTLQGRKESLKMANWLCDQSFHIELVLVSPYLRAKQTLNIMNTIQLLPKKRIVLSTLTPNSDPNIIACYLKNIAGEGVKSVLMISHLPLVSCLVSKLCPQEEPLIFTTAAIAYVNFNTNVWMGKLEWYVSPSELVNT